MKTSLPFLAASAASAALLFLAQAPALASGDHGAHKAAAGAAASTDMTDAEVRKVDMESGKVTLKHAEIKSLDMPPMTMVFVVKDKALLANVKAGDKVKFKAINDAGKFTVTEIQTAR